MSQVPVPDRDRAVVVGGGQLASVWAEDHLCGLAEFIQLDLRLIQRCGMSQVPDRDRVVVAGVEQGAVRAEYDGAEPGMAGQRSGQAGVLGGDQAGAAVFIRLSPVGNNIELDCKWHVRAA